MSVFTPIDDNVSDLGDLVSKELMLAIANNVNNLIESTSVGMITPILYGFTGVPAPDPDIWQLCDGSPITNAKSPLRGYNTPDFSDGRMIKGATSSGTPGTRGGAHTRSLEHDHGGVTGIVHIWVPAIGQSSGDTDYHSFNAAHVHSVTGNAVYGDTPPLSATPLDPVHLKILHYIKIT